MGPTNVGSTISTDNESSEIKLLEVNYGKKETLWLISE